MFSRPPGIRILRAGPADIERLLPLFDAYRQWYGQATDRDGARAFLTSHLEKGESAVFLAEADGVAIGFVQLYPSFSSISMTPWWILNDLFVVPEARGKGIASLLLDRARDLASETGASGLSLETTSDNPARRLYEAKGWKQDEEFLHYVLRV